MKMHAAFSSVLSKTVAKMGKTDNYKCFPALPKPASNKRIKRKSSKRSFDTSVLTKPQQKRFEYVTRFHKKINLSNFSKSCFQLLERGEPQTENDLTSSVSSDASQKKMNAASNTTLRLHRQFRVESSLRQSGVGRTHRQYKNLSRSGRIHPYRARLQTKQWTVASL